MPEVSVQIANRTYELACGEGEIAWALARQKLRQLDYSVMVALRRAVSRPPYTVYPSASLSCAR